MESLIYLLHGPPYLLERLGTVAAPLIAAASNQKIFSGQLALASIQERPLIKKEFYRYSDVNLKSI